MCQGMVRRETGSLPATYNKESGDWRNHTAISSELIKSRGSRSYPNVGIRKRRRGHSFTQTKVAQFDVVLLVQKH